MGFFLMFLALYSSWARWYGSDSHVYAYVVLQWFALSVTVVVITFVIAMLPAVRLGHWGGGGTVRFR